MRKKSKELLDNLNKITQKPNRFEPPKSIPDTNRLWKSQLKDEFIHKWPKQYHEGPWNKEVDDEGNVDYWTPFDRIYGGLYGINLTQKDGTQYTGKIHRKRRLVQGMDGKNFYTEVRVTADGRWFDNGGFPIDPPTKVEENEEKQEVSFVKPELTEEEKAEQAKYEREAEADMLKKLK